MYRINLAIHNLNVDTNYLISSDQFGIVANLSDNLNQINGWNNVLLMAGWGPLVQYDTVDNVYDAVPDLIVNDQTTGNEYELRYLHRVLDLTTDSNNFHYPVCKGDSGSGLFSIINNQLKLVGVLSAGGENGLDLVALTCSKNSHKYELFDHDAIDWIANNI